MKDQERAATSFGQIFASKLLGMAFIYNNSRNDTDTKPSLPTLLLSQQLPAQLPEQQPTEKPSKWRPSAQYDLSRL
jgi:hypothetical protein